MAYTTIDKPSDYFNTKLYTGNAGTQSISGIGFRPDWIWTKGRSGARGHTLVDVIRGATKTLETATQTGEETHSNSITSIDSDGFSLGNRNQGNANSETFVAWNWLAANGTASNENGSITSTVSANQTSGFSIVSWTGNGSAATIGHGLGSAPKVVIIKSRDSSTAWFLGHESLGWTKYMTLENANGENTDVIWNNTAPTSSVFSVGGYSSTNGSGVKFIAYCFADTGNKFFKAGSYTGNGNADGTFVYLGFKPAWVLVKNTSGSGDNWILVDNKRLGYNPDNRLLFPNASNADYTDNNLDLLSNGFKARVSYDPNGSGNTMIYMAFAENPFVTSSGVPACAR